MSCLERYTKLKEIDPLLANKYHMNDYRKITTYLKKALLFKTPPSSNFKDHSDVPLRNSNCLIFWPRFPNMEKLKEKQY